MPATSTERSLQSAFTPLRHTSIPLNSTASATPALLTADLTGDQVRRVTIKNQHATQLIAVCFVARGASIAALTTASGYQLSPGQEFTFSVHSDTSIALVASGAATSFTALVSDT